VIFFGCRAFSVVFQARCILKRAINCGAKRTAGKQNGDWKGHTRLSRLPDRSLATHPPTQPQFTAIPRLIACPIALCMSRHPQMRHPCKPKIRTSGYPPRYPQPTGNPVPVLGELLWVQRSEAHRIRPRPSNVTTTTATTLWVLWVLAFRDAPQAQPPNQRSSQAHAPSPPRDRRHPCRPAFLPSVRDILLGPRHRASSLPQRKFPR
jgi:hypothetical protein